jgi:hypothetical protein
MGFGRHAISAPSPLTLVFAIPHASKVMKLAVQSLLFFFYYSN